MTPGPRRRLPLLTLFLLTSSACKSTVEAPKLCADVRPRQVNAEVSQGTITLTWLAGPEPAQQFEVERQVESGPWRSLGVMPDTSYQDLDLSPDQALRYRVSGLSEGCAPQAVDLRALTWPRAAADLELQTLSPSSLLLRWTDSNQHEQSYTVERQQNDGTFAELVVLPTDSQIFQLDELSAGEELNLRLITRNASGVQATSRAVSGATSTPPSLEWAGPPPLDPSCRLSAPATARFDATHAASFVAATGSLPHFVEVVADEAGLRGRLDLRDAASGTMRWSVRDSLGGQSSIARDFELLRQDDGFVLYAPLLAAATGSQAEVPGRQAHSLAQGTRDRCSSCQGQRASLSLGLSHTCFVDAAGHARCSGNNGQGQLAHSGSPRQFNAVVACAQGSADIGCDADHAIGDVISLASGSLFTCLLTGDGRVLCSGDNAQGQLGDTTREDRSLAAPVCLAPLGQGLCPSASQPPRFVGLAAGDAFACALSEAGQVWCWGSNDHYQLGNGTAIRSTRPRPMCASGSDETHDCLPLGGITGLALGHSHACLIGEQGQLWCLGNNTDGQLGDGTALDRRNPTPVCLQGTAEDNCLGQPLQGVLDVALGRGHSCALLADRSVICWGHNGFGQLGQGDFFPKTSAVPVCQSIDQGRCTPLADIVGVEAWRNSSCALRSDGVLWCWGQSTQGQLGSGTRFGTGCGAGILDGETCQDLPRPVCSDEDPVLGCSTDRALGQIVAFALGASGACAVRHGGRLWCWGANDAGQLGDGTQASRDLAAPACAIGVGAFCSSAGGGGHAVDDVAWLRCHTMHISTP